MPPKFNAPDGVPVKGPLSEEEAALLRTAYADLDQQASDNKDALEALQKDLDEGVYLKPEDAVKKAIEAGEVFEKKRFTGLQQTNEQLTKDLKEKDELVSTLQTSTKAFETEKSSLTSTIQAKEDALAEKDKLLASQAAKSERLSLIVNEYPGLASFEGEGLLPTANTVDELKPLLEKFQEKVGTLQDQARQEFGKGGGTHTPGGADDNDPKGVKPSKAEALLSEAKSLIASGKLTEYEEKYQEYQDALSQEAGNTDNND